MFFHSSLHFAYKGSRDIVAVYVVPLCVVQITTVLTHSYTNAILASTAIWLSRKPVCVPGQYRPVRPFPGSFVYGVRKANPVIHCAGKVFCFNEFIFVSRVNLDQHSTVILACRICVVPRLSCCEKFIT